jgi:hypothetical protein
MRLAIIVALTGVLLNVAGSPNFHALAQSDSNGHPMSKRIAATQCMWGNRTYSVGATCVGRCVNAGPTILDCYIDTCTAQGWHQDSNPCFESYSGQCGPRC